MDYLDVVVHIFTPQAREYYRLEQLWGEAPSRVADSASASSQRANRRRRASAPTAPTQPAPRGQ